MKKFYSLIKIVPNPARLDMVVIGLIAYDGVAFRVKISNRKIGIAKRLMSSEKQNIDFIENTIIEKIDELNHGNTKNVFFDENYFNYLEKYSNGIMQFSAANIIEKDIFGIFDFEKLFALFVDNSIENDYTIKENIKEFVEINLIEKVKEKVNTNFIVDSNFNSLFNFKFSIDCIGLNGSFVAAKLIDFSQTLETINKQLQRYKLVSSEIVEQYDRKAAPNNFYIIANEPQIDDKKMGYKKHKIW